MSEFAECFVVWGFFTVVFAAVVVPFFASLYERAKQDEQDYNDRHGDAYERTK